MQMIVVSLKSIDDDYFFPGQDNFIAEEVTIRRDVTPFTLRVLIYLPFTRIHRSHVRKL